MRIWNRAEHTDITDTESETKVEPLFRALAFTSRGEWYMVGGTGAARMLPKETEIVYAKGE